MTESVCVSVCCKGMMADATLNSPPARSPWKPQPPLPPHNIMSCIVLHAGPDVLPVLAKAPSTAADRFPRITQPPLPPRVVVPCIALYCAQVQMYRLTNEFAPATADWKRRIVESSTGGPGAGATAGRCGQVCSKQLWGAVESLGAGAKIGRGDELCEQFQKAKPQLIKASPHLCQSWWHVLRTNPPLFPFLNTHTTQARAPLQARQPQQIKASLR